MKIYYENSKGRVDFGFGDGELNVLALEGFGIVNPQYKTAEYYSHDGEYTLDEHTGARCISISCDIKASNMRVSKILGILSAPGMLVVSFGQKNRRIYCRRTAVSEAARFGKYLRFVFQLTADMPYFEEIYPKKSNIYHITKLIGPSFQLPAKLGELINTVSIMNIGDKKCEPVVYIVNNSVLPYESAGHGIEITNLTNGTFLKINTNTVKNEIITIDIPARTVESNLRGNLLYCISEDTYLNSFVFDTGVNVISVTNRNTNERITVAAEFYPRYAEAVY